MNIITLLLIFLFRGKFKMLFIYLFMVHLAILSMFQVAHYFEDTVLVAS
jgi:hypothetical protein